MKGQTNPRVILDPSPLDPGSVPVDHGAVGRIGASAFGESEELMCRISVGLSSKWRISELDDEGDGGPGLVVAGPDAPHGAQGPDGVHRITLDVTLLGSGRLDSFKGTFHTAVACLMAHQPVP